TGGRKQTWSRPPSAGCWIGLVTPSGCSCVLFARAGERNTKINSTYNCRMAVIAPAKPGDRNDQHPGEGARLHAAKGLLKSAQCPRPLTWKLVQQPMLCAQ